MATFFSLYADEQSCKEFFKEKRERHGNIICIACGSLQLRWIEKESRWRCKECKHPMSLKQGTVMENSNLSFKTWLWCLYLMSLTKKGFSALEMQRLLGHSRYESIWLMMHKIRISMGHRDKQYTLSGYIEMDEGFFEGQRNKDEGGNPSKELDRQVKAIVAVSTKPIAVDKQRKGHPDTQAGYIKMNVVSSLCNNEVGCEATTMIQKSATVVTDGRRCYNTLQEICTEHKAIIIKDKTEISKAFPWVHTAISNVKKKLLGLHHQIKNSYMQNYLNEFCYKFNRRFSDSLFDRVIVAALNSPWYKPNYG